jgi:nitrite reductase/ring-hydroxylating ferredoxin subunit
MLTDLPIGFWTSAFVFDLLPGRKYDDAARALIGLGVLSAIPTAVSGAADWNDTQGPARRVGAVHALVNSSALVMYIASWRARGRGRRLAGIGWAMGGATLASLGGHLVDALGVGVDNTAFAGPVADWTRCAELADLTEGPTRCPITADADALVIRRGNTALAVSATCPHRGAPLEEGEIDGDAVVCPWHGSRFSLIDGSVEAGPSAAPLRVYDVRISDGAVEVREHRD